MIVNLNANKLKGQKKSIFNKRNLFIFLMLAYPVAHFLIMWVFVNIDSILLTFRRFVIVPNDEFTTAGWHFIGFENYKNLLSGLGGNQDLKNMLINSVSYSILNVVVILPLSIGLSYLFYKRIRFSRFFRTLFFLPSILPLMVLTLSYQMALAPGFGVFNILLKTLGVTPPLWFAGEPWAQRSIWMFCIWVGFGYGTIMVGSAMSRIPKDVIEAGKLDGVGYMRELVQIVIPLVWPTISTQFILGLMAAFGIFAQPLFLTGGASNTKTISLEIFFSTRGQGGLEQAATLGLMFSLVGAPIVMIARKLIQKPFKDVDF